MIIVVDYDSAADVYQGSGAGEYQILRCLKTYNAIKMSFIRSALMRPAGPSRRLFTYLFREKISRGFLCSSRDKRIVCRQDIMGQDDRHIRGGFKKQISL